jgi:hypothetical protein
MSSVVEIKDEDSKSGVKMIKGLLVVKLFSKSCFVDVVVAFRMSLVLCLSQIIVR